MQRPIFTPNIDAGHILQALVIAAGVIFYASVVSGKADDANRKIDDLKVAVDRGLADLGTKITSLPDYAARLAQTERRTGEIEVRLSTVENKISAHLDAIDTRLTRDEIGAADFQSRLSQIEAASGPVRKPR